METMDKRAEEFADKKIGMYLMPDDNVTLLTRHFYEKIYKEVTKEQQAIDIEKAWNFIRSNGSHFIRMTWEEIEEEYRKFMEE